MPVGGHHCTLQTSTYCSYGKNHPPLTENSPSLAVLQELEKEKDSQAAVRPPWGDRFKSSSTEQALRGRLCGHYGDTKLKADWQPVTSVPTHKLFLFSLRTGSHQADLRMVTRTDVPLSRWLRLRPRIWEQAPRRSSSPVRGNKTSWGTWWTQGETEMPAPSNKEQIMLTDETTLLMRWEMRWKWQINNIPIMASHQTITQKMSSILPSLWTCLPAIEWKNMKTGKEPTPSNLLTLDFHFQDVKVFKL